MDSSWHHEPLANAFAHRRFFGSGIAPIRQCSAGAGVQRTLLAERQVEIIADRGIHAKVGSAEWERIYRMMESAFRENRFEQGVLDGIREITVLLARHFPATGANPNELPDAPVLI
jgi:uncharacterized membrane protein